MFFLDLSVSTRACSKGGDGFAALEAPSCGCRSLLIHHLKLWLFAVFHHGRSGIGQAQGVRKLHRWLRQGSRQVPQVVSIIIMLLAAIATVVVVVHTLWWLLLLLHSFLLLRQYDLTNHHASNSAAQHGSQRYGAIFQPANGCAVVGL